jgi:hypothetical protein
MQARSLLSLKRNNMKNTLKQRLFSLPILAMALAAMPLSAQDSGWSKLNYGLQAGVMIPQGELKDYVKTGFGVAGYMEKVWSNNWALRGRLEYVMFGDKSESFDYGSYGNESYTSSLSQVGIMADAIYYGLHDKFYLFGGAGYFNRSAEVKYNGDFPGWGQYEESLAKADNEAAFSLGVGWNFTPHLGAEIKYTVCEYNWIQASVLYRF